MRSRTGRYAVAAQLSLLMLLAQPAARAAETSGPGVDVLAVDSTSDHQVSLIARLRPAMLTPLRQAAVTVSAESTDLPAQTWAVLSDQSAVAVVVDTSAGGALSLQRGGRAGIAGLLLQLPPNAPGTVIADRTPPTVAAKASVGVSDDLAVVSALQSGGDPATSGALTLALQQLPATPGIQPVIVLYTSQPNAGGEPAAELGARLRRAHTVLAVVNTSIEPGYWSDVAASTGGVSLMVRPVQATKAFDLIADALRARSVITFPRPTSSPGGPVTLQIKRGRQSLVATVALPPESTTPTSSAAPTGAGRAAGVTSRWWLWPAGIIGLVTAAALMIVLRRRRSRSQQPAAGPTEPARRPAASPTVPIQGTGTPMDAGRAATDAETLRPNAPPGMRIFDVAQPGAPREITNSLFEPRAQRDAKAKIETAAASSAVEPPNPADKSLAARLARRRASEDRGRS